MGNQNWSQGSYNAKEEQPSIRNRTDRILKNIRERSNPLKNILKNTNADLIAEKTPFKKALVNIANTTKSELISVPKLPVSNTLAPKPTLWANSLMNPFLNNTNAFLIAAKNSFKNAMVNTTPTVKTELILLPKLPVLPVSNTLAPKPGFWANLVRPLARTGMRVAFGGGFIFAVWRAHSNLMQSLNQIRQESSNQPQKKAAMMPEMSPEPVVAAVVLPKPQVEPTPVPETKPVLESKPEQPNIVNTPSSVLPQYDAKKSQEQLKLSIEEQRRLYNKRLSEQTCPITGADNPSYKEFLERKRLFPDLKL